MSAKTLEQTTPPPLRQDAPPIATQGSFRKREFGTTFWLHTMPNGTPFSRALEPDYWVLMARSVTPGDRIEIMPEDATFFAELLVRATTDRTVRVHVLRHVEIPDDSTPRPELSFSVIYRGPNKRYCVMRNGEIVQDGYATAEAAMQAIPTLTQPA